MDIPHAQFSAEQARRHVDMLAEAMIMLAGRLRKQAQGMNGDGETSAVAADIVHVYTEFGARAGSRLWQLMTNAADADRAYRCAQRKD